MRPHDFRQLDDLVGRRVLGRRIVQPGRQADRALLQRLLERAPHGGDFLAVGGTVEPRHRADAQRRMSDLADGVERGRVAVQRRQISVEAGKKLLRLAADDVQRRRRIALNGERREADAAIAGDDGGDALADLAFHQRVAQQRAVVVGVGIDEAGRQREVLCRNLARTLQLRQVAQSNDPVVLHRQVAAFGRRSAAVDEQGIADDQVGCRLGRGHARLRCASCAGLPRSSKSEGEHPRQFWAKPLA